jgi:hypothetical protein
VFVEQDRTQFAYPCGCVEEADEILRCLFQQQYHGRYDARSSFSLELVHHGYLFGLTEPDLATLLNDWNVARSSYERQHGLASLAPVFNGVRIIGCVSGREKTLSQQALVRLHLIRDATSLSFNAIEQLLQQVECRCAAVQLSGEMTRWTTELTERGWKRQQDGQTFIFGRVTASEAMLRSSSSSASSNHVAEVGVCFVRTLAAASSNRRRQCQVLLSRKQTERGESVDLFWARIRDLSSNDPLLRADPQQRLPLNELFQQQASENKLLRGLSGRTPLLHCCTYSAQAERYVLTTADALVTS